MDAKRNEACILILQIVNCMWQNNEITNAIDTIELLYDIYNKCIISDNIVP